MTGRHPTHDEAPPQHRTAALTGGLALAIALVGCRGGDPLAAHVAARETVRTDVFVGPVAGATPRSAAAEPSATGAGAAANTIAASAPPPPDPAAGYAASPGAPTASPDAAPVRPPEIIEAKVGDVNGLPIFASEFLEPLAGRLRAEARRMDRREWIDFANEAIIDELNDLVLDELLRAEAVEQLSPEQQQGLLFFLGQMREDLESQNEGSRQVAERQLREQAGLSLREWEERQRQSTLIQFALRERISKRVSVSWRDIQQRYERDYDRFNPEPKAAFRLIAVPQRDTEAIEDITARLAAGEPFEDVAALPSNRFDPENAGARSFPFSGDLATARFFEGELNDVATSLADGEVRGPFKSGSVLLYWMKLESIERTSVDLYKAQSVIEAELRAERTREELARFLSQMVERADVNTLESIRRRLLAVAIERYAPGVGEPDDDDANPAEPAP